ncbi:uncharacterized protein LOC119406737 [Rhipicephalus sanguineus]|uniref:uncharacterized protein LOC119406737 n=1 Tax=Rhipicephalus sanguineus TaxID=34632 RepID=UPI0020C43589|nr:uncharacterized protein LOC119406737 [Rhipicephalus sanguineus]
MCHTLLSNTEKAAIAAKLREGVTVDAVLDGIRDNMDGTRKRIHLTTKQDLYNILRDYKIKNSERLHMDDHASVLLWVKHMENELDNPVLFFKHQGWLDKPDILSRNESELLDINDFMIVIMTEPQRDLLASLGSDRICIDGTHGTTGFDFQLVTLLCVDEFGVGFPVAFCITNKVDQKAMETFFKSVRQKHGEVTARVFMSDDAPSFYNAWQAIMGNVEKRLLCAWHIDKNWRQNIRQHIKDKELQAFTYKVENSQEVEENLTGKLTALQAIRLQGTCNGSKRSLLLLDALREKLQETPPNNEFYKMKQMNHIIDEIVGNQQAVVVNLGEDTIEEEEDSMDDEHFEWQ